MMLPKLQISSFVLKRLERLDCSKSSGCLYGIIYRGNMLILGFNLEDANGVTMNYKDVQNGLPAEIDLCGLIKIGQCSDAEAHRTEIIADVDVTDNPILLKCEPKGNNLKAFFLKNNELEATDFVIISPEELFQSFYFARLRFDINEFITSSNDITSAFMARRKYLAAGRLCFKIEGTDMYMNASSSGVSATGMNMDNTMEQVIKLTPNGKSGKSSGPAKSYKILDLQALVKRTPSEKSGHRFLQMTYSSTGTECEIPIQVDALSLLHKGTSIAALYDILVESVCRQLRLIEASLTDPNLSSLSRPQAFHFLLPEFGHFFTRVYPKACADDSAYLKTHRANLHKLFGLPLTQPKFIRALQWSPESTQPSNVLVDTHIGLKQSVPGGTQYLVQGSYGYHHYMQDSFDDNGWGCAYRSLQTLCSWFRHQGYSNRPIPTHSEIQSYLVRLGDKGKDFVGSRQWIGSTEVAMVLQAHMGIDSRILNVRSGAEMANLAPDLSIHFHRQGTPIMIGGGVLAHTILGIDHNDETNELKFLILDPHYTGAEDLATIQAKGWCGWKTVNFWDKKAYYNLCMPIRPNYI